MPRKLFVIVGHTNVCRPYVKTYKLVKNSNEEQMGSGIFGDSSRATWPILLYSIYGSNVYSYCVPLIVFRFSNVFINIRSSYHVQENLVYLHPRSENNERPTCVARWKRAVFSLTKNVSGTQIAFT